MRDNQCLHWVFNLEELEQANKYHEKYTQLLVYVSKADLIAFSLVFPKTLYFFSPRYEF